MLTLAPGPRSDDFVALLEAIRRAGGSFGPVLIASGLDLQGFEQLCLSWVGYCQIQPTLARDLLPQIEAALAAVSRTWAPVDDLMSYTLTTTPPSGTRAPSVLPFRDGPASQAAAPVSSQREIEAPPPGVADDSDLLWGSTLVVPTSAEPVTVLPFGASAPGSKVLPLERVAELVAMTIVLPDEARAALEKHEIDDAALREQSRHHLDQAGKAASSGDFSAIETYDRIYVETLERGRGTIWPDEYGRIVVASERRALEDVFESLRMKGARFVHIERHWLTRMAADPELFSASMNAIRAARRS